MVEQLIRHPERLVEEQALQAKAAETLLLDCFDDLWARGNADAVGHYLSKDFTFVPPPGYEPTRAGYEKLVRDLHKAFPDLQGDIMDVVGRKDTVAAHWIMEGTHKGTWMGIPPTGKKIRMEGLALDRIRDGHIVNEYVVQDMMDFLGQLGVTDLSQFPQ